MLDTWVKCAPVKVSPEAPVLICLKGEETFAPGGAANVAANLRTGFGLGVRLIGLQGNDAIHKTLIDTLTAHGIPTKYMVEDPAWVTIEKRRFVDGLGRHLLRLDTEIENPEVPEAIQANLNAHLHVASQECDTLIISDYGKGTVTAALARCAIQEARDRGKYVIVNGKPDRLLNYRGASLLVYNLAEAEAAWYKFGDGGDLYEPSDLAGALYQIINKHGDLTEVLITCGDRGMVLWTARGSRIAEAIPVKVADVTGAGDVTVATIAAFGYCNLEVMHEAAVNAAEVVSQHGTSICARKDMFA
jgi:D-beta-D-heptose 7-phosphate kinase/D-beta-D-heptose 1-phosphate adenosyltransferase